MIEIVPFEPDHFDQITPTAIFGNKPPGVRNAALTLMRNGVPVGIFGGFPVTMHTHQIWALFSEEAVKYPLSLVKSIKDIIRWAEETLQLRRLQVSVKLGYMQGWRFAETLGFKCEGIMKGYGDQGEDYWLFGRLNERT
jgi:hypothetical protein